MPARAEGRPGHKPTGRPVSVQGRAVEQLAARHPHTVEVAGSIPARAILSRRAARSIRTFDA